MQVRIGTETYDSGERPILLTLTDTEIREIVALPADERMYYRYPEEIDGRDVLDWVLDIGPEPVKPGAQNNGEPQGQAANGNADGVF